MVKTNSRPHSRHVRTLSAKVTAASPPSVALGPDGNPGLTPCVPNSTREFGRHIIPVRVPLPSGPPRSDFAGPKRSRTSFRWRPREAGGYAVSDMRPEYQSGAQNAVRTCLNIRSGDRVAVIEDREHADIAGAVKEEVEQTGADLFSWVMEDLVERPARSFARDLAGALVGVRPPASYYIGGSRTGALAF